MFVARNTLNTPGVITVRTCAVDSVPLLLFVFGSNVVAKADATFVNEPTKNDVFVSIKLYGLGGNENKFVELMADCATFNVKLVACPFVNTGNTGQTTAPFERTPPPDALVKSRFVGRKSFVNVLNADEGPPLLTTTV